MINLFFRNRRKSENALAPSIIKIIGVGNGGINVINHLQTHGFKKDSLWACDMDGSVVKRAVTTHCLSHVWVGAVVLVFRRLLPKSPGKWALRLLE